MIRTCPLAPTYNIFQRLPFSTYGTLQKIRNILSEKLVHAFIISSMDYCNSFFFFFFFKSGSPNEYIYKDFQLIQNSAAYVLTRTHITEHISPI